MNKLIFYLLISICTNAQQFYLKVKAKDSVEQRTIDSIFATKKFGSVKEIDEQINNLESNLIQKGYFRLQNQISKKNDSLFESEINLGKKIRFIIITYTKNEEEILKDLKINPSQKLQPIETSIYLEKIKNALAKKGYVFSKTYLTHFNEKDQDLESELKIELNQKRQINEVVVKGYDKFPVGLKKIIDKKWKEKTLNSENIAEIDKDFNNIPFVSKIKPTEILTTVDSTKVYAYLKKVKSNFFDGILGVRNNENTNKTELFGNIDVSLFNNLNYGERIRFNWRNDGNSQSVLNFSTEFNYIFKTRISQKNELQIFRQDSTFQNTKFRFQLGYLIQFKSKVFLGIQSSTSVRSKNIQISSIEDFDNIFYNATYNYESLNSSIEFFRENFKFNVEVGLGNRTNNKVKTPQQYIQLFTEKNFKLNERNYILIRSENYYLGSNNFLQNELYRFGGINSIRGFRENSLQANLLSGFSTEYRFLGSENLCFHTVIDTAYYEDKSQNLTNKLYAFGAGIILKRERSFFNFLFSNGFSDKNKEFSLKNSLIQIKVTSQF